MDGWTDTAIRIRKQGTSETDAAQHMNRHIETLRAVTKQNQEDGYSDTEGNQKKKKETEELECIKKV